MLHDLVDIRVVWASFDHVNPGARLVIAGITPGWQQTAIAYAEASAAVNEGVGYGDACRRAKARADRG